MLKIGNLRFFLKKYFTYLTCKKVESVYLIRQGVIVLKRITDFAIYQQEREIFIKGFTFVNIGLISRE